ncbi:uncharacterized protein EI97DRAFT_317464 [Westerdykella ornata]|uniref:Zn(2)-C6 fungal-type domain-containing protein n=1 Tax=Westerdykella ornata TaxID=318751 RepID=A0A6A6JJ70_WESOR|nr:uncharacterized protein EI97DRAFT_317464 [Westerdykella ornata]KAF2276680.1 hypothetical protein EI97DRAFT_317464 [Westerdykella ornata]
MDPPLDNFDSLYAYDAAYDPNRQHTYLLNAQHHQTWPLPVSASLPMSQQNGQHQEQHQQQHQDQRRVNTIAASAAPNGLPSTSTAVAPLQTSGLAFPSTMTMNPMLADWIGISSNAFSQQAYNTDLTSSMDPVSFAAYGNQLQTSPVDFAVNTSQGMMTSLPLESAPQFSMMPSTSMGLSQMAAMASQPPFQMADFQQELANFANTHDYTAAANASVSSGSPTEQFLEVRSLSSSDGSWIDVGPHRNSHDFSDQIIFNPGQALHIRTNSDSSQQSDVPRSAGSFSSFEEIQFPLHSPQSEAENSLEMVPSHSHSHSDCTSHSHSHSHSHSQPLNVAPNGLPMTDPAFAHYISPTQSVSPPVARAEPVAIKQTASSSASPTSSGGSSPPSRRRKSPVGAKPAKTIVKKPAHSTKKDHMGEKRVGKRTGPLRPDQRQQAHEIRKLRACLRCKFLKKTCDKGDPCGGCQPSHARLWQVPCTRIDIKDIAYFMKDWKADYERHVSLGFSVGNIKGFSPHERMIYITHGYGHYLPIMAREVYVRDEKCFGVDWIETLHGVHQFEINTAKLSAGMEGISHQVLSDYLDRHVDGGFERFVDEYFEGTYFVTEVLKTAYRFYCREKLPVLRKALKLVIAYNLTLHVTMVEGLPEDERNLGRVEDEKSKFCGKTVAPVMINFQVKCALADMWRELQKDVLEELSALYSSVYSGDKLKNWPTIFMLAAILLAVWELIQFDCSYRVPDQQAVNKFLSDMEGTPVGVIVGLFSAISQKLPAFTEWDTRKHHHLLNSNPAVCDAMTEVRAHVTKYESYLRTRSDCKFDRSDFDCLSNKFLSKLVIRAN